MKIGLNVKLAIVAGIINCIAWYLIAKSLNFYSLSVDQYRYFVTLILLVIGIFITVYFERKNNNGFLEFKVGAKSGILFSLILSAILGIFSYVYYKFMVPDAIDFFVSEAKKIMVENKLTDEAIAKNAEIIVSYFSPFRITMSTLILGVILSLVSGGIFRKKNPNTIETIE